VPRTSRCGARSLSSCCPTPVAARSVASFLREARSAAALTHPNVAVVYQVGEAEGRIYIAMELVEGENLRAKMERGRLLPDAALEVARQMARGLAAAHDKGIVHRDLKPENVMLTTSGVVKLLDFGLAKATPASDPTDTATAALAKTETVVTSDEGRIMGTPEYMSPEQATGQPLDVRSDVFAFGVVLYELLAGERPFVGPSTGAVLVAIARDPAPPLQDRAPDVDARIAEIVMRCLAKAPGERFADAGAVLAALEGKASPMAQTVSKADLAPVTGAAGTTVSTKRRAWPVALLGLGLVALGGGAAWRASAVRHAAPAPTASGAPSASAMATAVADLPPPGQAARRSRASTRRRCSRCATPP
jgi:serine/threonine-protein kinase